MQSDTEWQKATASDSQGECVEQRRRSGKIEVRHSKDPEGGILTFTPSEFGAWLDGAKNGEFDHLLK